jgi:hypothetical protein
MRRPAAVSGPLSGPSEAGPPGHRHQAPERSHTPIMAEPTGSGQTDEEAGVESPVDRIACSPPATCLLILRGSENTGTGTVDVQCSCPGSHRVHRDAADETSACALHLGTTRLAGAIIAAQASSSSHRFGWDGKLDRLALDHRLERLPAAEGGIIDRGGAP